MLKSKLAILLTCMTLLLLLGCADVIVWFTKEQASWTFIQDKCKGITLGTIELTSTQVSIPLNLWDHYDSAICIYDPKGYVNDGRVTISVKKGLCSGAPVKPLVVKITKPKYGDYRVVYDDPDANFPVLGLLHVD